jgi:molybdopterin converting factor small subunit
MLNATERFVSAFIIQHLALTPADQLPHTIFEGAMIMITVKLPSTLKIGASDTLEVFEPADTVAHLIDVLDRRIPGFREQLDDSVFNFAVNDEMLLHRARERALKDGDVVEVIPTISGG